MSNQVIAQRLLAQGLPTQPLEMLVLFMQFMANEVVNCLAQGESLEACFELTDRFARYESLRQRAVNTSLREAKAHQKAAAETPPEAIAEPAASTAPTEEETLTPPIPTSPPPPAIAERRVHLSRQQRRALLRKQTRPVGTSDDAGNAS